MANQEDPYTVSIQTLRKTGGMTQEHVSMYEDLYENYWRKVAPEIYGKFLPEAIEFVGFRLLDIEGMTFNQKSRAGSLNPKKTEIAQSIRRNGWKIKYHAIATLQHFTDPKTITGNTRTQILVEEGLKTVVVAEFRGKPGYSNDAVEEAFIYCSQIFNTDVDPSSPASMEDIQRAVTDLCVMFGRTEGKFGVNPHDLDDIREAVNRCCGKGQFQDKTRSTMAYSVYNEYNPNDIVVSWQKGTGAKYRLQDYALSYNFRDTDTVKYHLAASSSPLKAYAAAVELWNEFQDAEVRIVIHTGTLTGYDLEQTYIDRCSEFIDWFWSMAQKICNANDGNFAEFKKRVKIYAVMPALSRVHDLNKPVFINTRRKTMYQRTVSDSDMVFQAYEVEYGKQESDD